MFEPAPAIILPLIAALPEGGDAQGTPAPAHGDVPTIVAGLLTMAETMAPAILLRLLPFILTSLGGAVAVGVVAELLRRLVQSPDAGARPSEAPPAPPPSPGLVPPAMPGDQDVGEGSGPPPSAVPGTPGFTPPPALPDNAPTPAPDGPQGPVLSPMARPKPTPEELKRREEKLRAAGLPTKGEIPYVPPPTWTSSQPIPKVGKSGGYRDDKGREWKWPTGSQMRGGKPDHWDVNGPGREHRNVTPDGRFHHGKS